MNINGYEIKSGAKLYGSDLEGANISRIVLKDGNDNTPVVPTVVLSTDTII